MVYLLPSNKGRGEAASEQLLPWLRMQLNPTGTVWLFMEMGLYITNHRSVQPSKSGVLLATEVYQQQCEERWQTISVAVFSQ